MANVTWETFERYRQKGLDARRAGRQESARIYFLEAARAMVQLSKDAGSEELKNARRQMAERLLELAKEKNEVRGRRSELRGEAEGDGGEKDWAVKERPGVKFDDVAGLEGVKEEIKLKMVYPVRHPDLAEKFGIRAGGGVLLYGPPGTGKTMLARATAGELESEFFTVSAADMLSKWVGEAEQNIKKLFDQAKSAGRAVVFIDEIDALLPARRDEGSGVMARVVPQILQELDGFDRKGGAVLFMGATNVPWNLDPAVMRPGRFDEKVYVPLPDLEARRTMLDMYLSKRPLAPDVNLDDLAAQLEGFSGADIKHLCDRAAVIPFLKSVGGDEELITSSILTDVLAEVRPSVSTEQVKRFGQWAQDS